MPSEIFAGRDEQNILLIVESLARKEIQKLRAFIPPVAKQFRVIRRDDERRTIQKSGELLDLRDAFIQKMLRGFARGFQRDVALVNFLVPCSAGDFVIFDSGESTILRRWQMRFHIIKIQVEADVAVKITIARVAGITFVLAPDLARRIEIAPERGDSVRRENRRERSVARTWLGVQNAVCVEDE